MPTGSEYGTDRCEPIDLAEIVERVVRDRPADGLTVRSLGPFVANTGKLQPVAGDFLQASNPTAVPRIIAITGPNTVPSTYLAWFVLPLLPWLRWRGLSWRPLTAPLLVSTAYLALTLDFGLSYVETPQWGGLMLTMVIAVVGIVASLPLGILLALGRRSDMPVIRTFCIVFIEFWRGVPLITVLFMASVMLPLFLPAGVNFDKLMRALIGVTLFSAATQAAVSALLSSSSQRYGSATFVPKKSSA